MKFVFDVVIKKSRDKVWETFDNPDNMPKWLPTLTEFKTISGKPGTVGAVAELIYNDNGRTVILKETITSVKVPEEMSGTYETLGTINRISNRFVAISAHETQWSMETDFQFQGLFKLMAPFMKSAMRKRTLENMHNFKALAESM